MSHPPNPPDDLFRPLVLQGDRATAAEQSLPLVVVLDNLRSAHNTGNIFRIAEAVGARALIACGHTPQPGHAKLAKTAMGSEAMVPCRHFASLGEALEVLRAEGYRLVAVETVAEAVSYHDWIPAGPSALIFGNEALGIHPEALAQCQDFISLPARGRKNSINVATAAAATLFHAAHHLARH